MAGQANQRSISWFALCLPTFSCPIMVPKFIQCIFQWRTIELIQSLAVLHPSQLFTQVFWLKNRFERKDFENHIINGPIASTNNVLGSHRAADVPINPLDTTKATAKAGEINYSPALRRKSVKVKAASCDSVRGSALSWLPITSPVSWRAWDELPEV